MKSRRGFLATTGAGVLGLAASKVFAARPPDAGIAGLMTVMRERIKQIRTFYLACDLRVDGAGAGWSREDLALNSGSIELAWDGRIFAAIHRRPGFTITEIEKPDTFKQWIDYEAVAAPRKVIYDGPRANEHRIAFSIGQFLPLPGRDGVEDGDPVVIRGRSTRKIFASHTRFFVDDDSRVNRTERLHPKSAAIVETIDYDDFTFPLPFIPFPSAVASQKPGQSPLITTVTTVEINASVPRQLPGVE